MEIDKQRLKAALSIIHEDKKGYFSSGRFASAVSDMIDMRAQLHELDEYLKYILMDTWNLETISLRIAWQRSLWTQKQLEESLWSIYTSCDISFFHVELRSVFDYLAKIIITLSDSYLPSKIRKGSFRTLRQWVFKEDDNAQKLGRDLARIVQSCGWFDSLRAYRDSIVHRGDHILIFPHEDRILFQIYQGVQGRIRIPEIMFDKNVVDFELYAGLYIGYLMAYLEEFSEMLYKRCLKKTPIIGAQIYHPGFQVVSDWIKQVLNCDNKDVV